MGKIIVKLVGVLILLYFFSCRKADTTVTINSTSTSSTSSTATTSSNGAPMGNYVSIDNVVYLFQDIECTQEDDAYIQTGTFRSTSNPNNTVNCTIRFSHIPTAGSYTVVSSICPEPLDSFECFVTVFNSISSKGYDGNSGSIIVTTNNGVVASSGTGILGLQFGGTETTSIDVSIACQ